MTQGFEIPKGLRGVRCALSRERGEGDLLELTAGIRVVQPEATVVAALSKAYD